MQNGSVLYVSFGSMVRTVFLQLEEIALGLEASKRPFLWVIKSDNMPSETDKLFLPEGFEERTRGRGLIIQGWAPQALILSHPSVGGFVTHCGWNSKIEGVSAGLPMITWPHCAEQFLNEELIMNALKVGLAVGVQSITNRTMKAHEISVVKRDQIERAVVELMGDETGAEERRARAKELKEKARKAIDEGSSYNNVRQLIEYISSRGTRCSVMCSFISPFLMGNISILIRINGSRPNQLLSCMMTYRLFAKFNIPTLRLNITVLSLLCSDLH